MGRWEPDARGRIAAAAVELYLERGFEQTTVADIAERAGLTKRTFFRHFADKREVLFAGSASLQEMLVARVAAAAAGVTPFDAVIDALAALDEVFERDRSRVRRDVIAATPDLQERELIKMATLAAAFTAVLHERGVPEPAAGLSAGAGVTVYRTGFDRWVDAADARTFSDHVREAAVALRAAVGGVPAPPGARLA